MEADADPDHPGRVEPAERPDPGQVVVHHMEDGPCDENTDHAHRQGHAQPDQHPDPHGQSRTRRADHRDTAVGTDAERDQQEEQALTGGIALARGGEVRDGQGDALLRGHSLEDLLGRHRRGVRVRLRDQEFGATRIGEEGADQVPVEQSLFGGGPVRQRGDVERVARPALHRPGQGPRLRGDADDRDLQMVRLGLVEGALVRERHPEAHQQRGEQVERQVLERVPHSGRFGCGPGCAHEVRSVLRRSPAKETIEDGKCNHLDAVYNHFGGGPKPAPDRPHPAGRWHQRRARHPGPVTPGPSPRPVTPGRRPRTRTRPPAAHRPHRPARPEPPAG